MSKLDDDGQLLSASLESRIEEVASEAGADLLSKYDESTVRLLNEMVSAHARILPCLCARAPAAPCQHAKPTL